MERIVIFARTTKTEGDIKLRFRLTDGRRADLYHKSNIKASLADLSKFNVDGSLRPKVSVYNKELEDSITREIDAMRRAYRKMVEAGGIITAVKFEEEVAKELNPEVIIRKEEKTLLSVLHKYIEDGYRDGLFGISRYKHFNGLHNRMERYFKINGLEQMTPAEFDVDEIMKFRQFLFDEYLYVPKHKRIYKDLKKLEIPTKRRGSNTVAQEVKMLITFFNYLEVRDEIVKSPFRRMNRDLRKKITQTKEDDPFFLTINAVHETLQAQAAHAVNLALTARNWLIGYYIVEFEQHGEDRAAYGEKLLKKLESRIIGKGMNERRFRDFRRLYLTYPQLAVPVESYVANNSEIRRLATAEFTEETQSADTQAISIPADRLLGRLSSTHLIIIAAIKDPLKRAFYEIEAINGCWTTDELDRQINSLYFERSGMSKNKEALAALVNKQAVKLKPTDVLHDPVALEFLETEKKSTWTEKDLEDAIVGHLQEFLLEMGNGFCFEFRQKRILIDSDYFKADLIFYHRILKCHVIIDVKIDRFRHEYASQMNTYLNYYKYEVMQPGDNPPVGILFCTGKGDTLVKYATAGLDQNIFVQKYMVSLPSVDDLTTYVADETKKEILRLSAPSTKSMNTTRFSANRPDWHWPQASPG